MKCPLCLSERGKLFHEWPDFRILDCENCGFRFTDLQTWTYPYDGHDYYAEISPRDIDVPPSAWVERRIKTLLKYASGGRSIDIGCGIGEVPIALKKQGFDSEGLDESEKVIGLFKVDPGFWTVI